MLKTENDFKEWQANVVASCLLLRPPLVEWAMFTFTRKEKITVFGEYQLYRQDRYQLRMMAEYLGVSISCLLYRLDRLEMLDRKPFKEYDPVMDHFWLWRWYNAEMNYSWQRVSLPCEKGRYRLRFYLGCNDTQENTMQILYVLNNNQVRGSDRSLYCFLSSVRSDRYLQSGRLQTLFLHTKTCFNQHAVCITTIK